MPAQIFVMPPREPISQAFINTVQAQFDATLIISGRNRIEVKQNHTPAPQAPANTEFDSGPYGGNAA